MNRYLVIFALAFVCAFPAHAQRVNASAPDPYVLGEMQNDNTIVPGFRDASAYTEITIATLGGAKRCLLVFFGQSNSVANYQQDTYSLTNPTQEFVFNVYNGGLYKLQWPILGAGGPETSSTSSWVLRLADNLINAGTCDRVIIASDAISSSFAADWQVGGQINSRIKAMANRIAANFPYAASMVAFEQGESDCNAGTVQATYTTELSSVDGSIAAAFPGIPRYYSQSSYYQGTTCTAQTIPQAALVNGTTIFSMGNSDLLGSGDRWDNIHFNSAGCTAWATTVAANLAAHMIVR